MKIKVDVDGVLRDFIWKLQQVYYNDFPTHTLRYVDDWDLKKFFPLGEGIYDYAFNFKAEEIFVNAPPYRGQIEALRRFIDRRGDDFSLIIVSTQPEENEEYTRIWLDRNRVPYDELVFTKKKSEAPGRILLDDAYHNLSEVSKAGQIAICQTRPWNRSAYFPKVRNMREFLTICEVLQRYHLL